MKIAISNIAWNPDEELDIIRLMQQHHISGIEIAPTKIWTNVESVTPADLHAQKEIWRSRSVSIVALQSLLFGHPELTLFENDVTRQRTTEYLKATIDIASGVGATALVFGSPRNRKRDTLPLETAFSIAVDFFSELGEYAAKRNTVFCIEPNPSAYGCDFICNSSEARALVKAVSCAGFRMHLDAGILTMNEENIEFEIEQSAPWLHHFHISDPQLGVIGTGITDHARIAKALRDVGYSGWVSIEMRNGWTTPNTTSVSQALENSMKWYGGN